jgi:hypothetical protein
VHLFDEAAKARRQSRDLGALAVAIRAPDQPFQQPCADAIEGLDPRHIERDALRVRDLRRGRLDQAFEHVRMRGSPRSAGGKLEPAGRHRAVEGRYRIHVSHAGKVEAPST